MAGKLRVETACSSSFNFPAIVNNLKLTLNKYGIDFGNKLSFINYLVSFNKTYGFYSWQVLNSSELMTFSPLSPTKRQTILYNRMIKGKKNV